MSWLRPDLNSYDELDCCMTLHAFLGWLWNIEDLNHLPIMPIMQPFHVNLLRQVSDFEKKLSQSHEAERESDKELKEGQLLVHFCSLSCKIILSLILIYMTPNSWLVCSRRSQSFFFRYEWLLMTLVNALILCLLPWEFRRPCQLCGNKEKKVANNSWQQRRRRCFYLEPTSNIYSLVCEKAWNSLEPAQVSDLGSEEQARMPCVAFSSTDLKANWNKSMEGVVERSCKYPTTKPIGGDWGSLLAFAVQLFCKAAWFQLHVPVHSAAVEQHYIKLDTDFNCKARDMGTLKKQEHSGLRPWKSGCLVDSENIASSICTPKARTNLATEWSCAPLGRASFLKRKRSTCGDKSWWTATVTKAFTALDK